MRGAPDALDATLGRGGDVVEGVAGEVGQLHALEVGPQRLDLVEVGGVGGQRLHHQPGPLPALPSPHRVAAVGGLMALTEIRSGAHLVMETIPSR